MLFKRVIVKRDIIDNFESPTKKTVIFRRVQEINMCYEFNPGQDEENWEESWGKPWKPDPRCKYKNNCTLRYTCRKINNDPRHHFSSLGGEYIPTV